MIHTETLYQASIYFDVDTDDAQHNVEVIERICDKALFEGRMQVDPKVEVTTNEGGPCWGPYIVFVGTDGRSVMRVATRVETYVKRFKGVKFY